MVKKITLKLDEDQIRWIYDMLQDYKQMLSGTRAAGAEGQTMYEELLKAGNFPEGVTAKDVAGELEHLKEMMSFVDVAESRTYILDTLFRTTLGFDVEQSEGGEPTEIADGQHSTTPESVHEVSDENKDILPEQTN